MQNCAFSSKKKKKRKEREEKLLLRKRDPFVRWFRPIPPAGWNPWLAVTLFGFQARDEVAVSAPVKQQMPSSEAFYFLRVPLAETAPHLEVNVSYSLPTKLRNLGEKKPQKEPREPKERCIERIWYVFEWVRDKQASWGVDMGVHKGFCAIWIVGWGGGVLGINVEEVKGVPWGFRGLSWTRLPWWLSW